MTASGQDFEAMCGPGLQGWTANRSDDRAAQQPLGGQPGDEITPCGNTVAIIAAAGGGSNIINNVSRNNTHRDNEARDPT
eukprot:4835251-Alexandrium_andersonii.AAC.1